MSDKMLIPSIEKRLDAFSELIRRNEAGNHPTKSNPAITISREFGCEAYPMAELLQKLMEKRTGNSWTIMDKTLLEEVAKDHDLSEKTLKSLGEQSGFVDEIIATFSPAWKTDKDYYRMLCRQIYSLAHSGNVIILGRGAANITQSVKNCCHFKLFASMKLKIRLIAQRMELSDEEAEKLIIKKQHQRDIFINDFLNQDARDLRFYHLIFNNDKSSSNKIAAMIMEYVLTEPFA
jgi:cytidylate kinase